MAIKKDDIGKLTEIANENLDVSFKGETVEIKEEDFANNFDNHSEAKKFTGELKSRKDVYLDYAEGCNKYSPCPVCYKCRNKGSHLYVKCDRCPIPVCVHPHEIISKFIKRENFTVKAGELAGKLLRNLEEKTLRKNEVK